MKKKIFIGALLITISSNNIIFGCLPWLSFVKKNKIYTTTENLEKTATYYKNKRIEEMYTIYDIQAQIKDLETDNTESSLIQRSRLYKQCITIIDNQLLYDPTLRDPSKILTKTQHKYFLEGLKTKVDNQLRQINNVDHEIKEL